MNMHLCNIKIIIFWLFLGAFGMAQDHTKDWHEAIQEKLKTKYVFKYTGKKYKVLVNKKIKIAREYKYNQEYYYDYRDKLIGWKIDGCFYFWYENEYKYIFDKRYKDNKFLINVFHYNANNKINEIGSLFVSILKEKNSINIERIEISSKNNKLVIKYYYELTIKFLGEKIDR